MDPALGAEAVIDHVLVERVGAGRGLRGLHGQTFSRNEPQEGSPARTDGTVTRQPAIYFAFNFERDVSAVAASNVGRHCSYSKLAIADRSANVSNVPAH